MGYPSKVPAFIEGRPGKKRAHATLKGTRQNPLPSAGTPGPHRAKTWQKVLMEAAMPYIKRSQSKLAKESRK